jgi:hypothetical protein
MDRCKRGQTMRRLSCTLFTLLLLDGAVSADEPRVLIERAVKALGGTELVGQPMAIRMKVKGTMHFSAGADQAIKVDGEVFEFGPRSRVDFGIDIAVAKARAIVVINGDKSWRDFDGHAQDFSREEIDSLHISRHVDRVTGLTALLSDKDFTFAPLPDVKVEGRPAAGIKVSYKGEADTSLYFDKETGLLIKYAYRAKKSGDAKVALHETVLSDYREPDPASADERSLRAAGVEMTGPALLALIRQHTPDPAKVEQARRLVRQLADDRFAAREKASAELVKLGPVAVPFLRDAAKSNDSEVVRRARDCLKQIGEERDNKQMALVVHLLGRRRPAGTVEALLNYLPAADADAAREAKAVLFALGHSEKGPDPALVKALEDKDPARRAAAAALGKDGGAYARQAGRRVFDRIRKFPTREKSWTDGVLHMEMQMFDFEFFNAFEDKLFARP